MKHFVPKIKRSSKLQIIIIGLVTLFFSSCVPLLRAFNYIPSDELNELSFTDDLKIQDLNFYYSDTLNNMYLQELRKVYRLDTLTENIESEMEKILTVLNWTSQQWNHNGNNTPTKQDALSILQDAKNGCQFRCVEYGIVSAAALNSISITARVLGLKTKDVETVKRGAGHVVAEVFSRQHNKWIFIDPQFNVMPTLNKLPLNAIEFQDAIMNNRNEIELLNQTGLLNKNDTERYLTWVGKYLFYFDALFDQRSEKDIKYKRINGKTKLMLVPVGEKEPTIFQKNNPINYCLYTNSKKEFYMIPE